MPLANEPDKENSLCTISQLPSENYYFLGVPHKWHSTPSMGPIEGPKKVVTTFCTYLPYKKIFKNVIFTTDFAVDDP